MDKLYLDSEEKALRKELGRMETKIIQKYIFYLCYYRGMMTYSKK